MIKKHISDWHKTSLNKFVGSLIKQQRLGKNDLTDFDLAKYVTNLIFFHKKQLQKIEPFTYTDVICKNIKESKNQFNPK